MRKQLILLPLFALLTSCVPVVDESSQIPESNIIKVWANEEESEIINNAITRYNENKLVNEQIGVNIINKNPYDTNDLFASENKPDLILSNDLFLKHLVKNDLVEPVSGLDKNNLYQSIYDSLLVNNTMYSYPLYTEQSTFAWYDSSYFANYENMSFEDILHKAKEGNYLHIFFN